MLLKSYQRVQSVTGNPTEKTMEYNIGSKPQSTCVSLQEMAAIKNSLKSVFKKCSNICIEGKVFLTVEKYSFILHLTADQGGDKVADVTSKLFEFSLKTGAELMQSPDDIFQAAINIFGKTVVGNSLSKLSATQCAGLIGVVVTSLAPQV